MHADTAPAIPLRPARWNFLRSVLLGLLLFYVLLSIAGSRRWGLTHDLYLMHYAVFLMQHGFAPYRDIIEMNMPVSYMVEWLAMTAFGPGDLGMRLFDLCMLAIASGSAAYLALSRGRFAAALAALLVAIVHLAGGTPVMGQRDFFLAVFLLLGTACLVFAIRRAQPWAMAAFAIFYGFAAGIKPFVFPLPFLLLIWICVLLPRRGVRSLPYVLCSFAGALLPTLLIAGFLHHFGVRRDFFSILRGLAVYHRNTGNLPLHSLVFSWLPWTFAPLAIFVPLLIFLLPAAARTSVQTQTSSPWSWEDTLLVALTAFGIVSYIYQGKGWHYQATTALMFLATLAARLIATTLRSAAPLRTITAAIACLVLLLPAGYTTVSIFRHPWTTLPLDVALRHDLVDFGGAEQLNGRVQCLDWNYVCIGSLYQLRILPSTGFLYDFYLFPAHPSPVTDDLQRRFLSQVQSDPPRIFILTSHDWPDFQGFAKLDRWPLFRDWMNHNYVLFADRHPPDHFAYRIYIRR
jgi:hypothetical protein